MKNNTILELVNAVLKLDWSSVNNMQLKQLIAEADADNFDDEFQQQLYLMIEKLAEKRTNEQGKAEAANLDVVDLLLLISYFSNQEKIGKLVLVVL